MDHIIIILKRLGLSEKSVVLQENYLFRHPGSESGMTLFLDSPNFKGASIFVKDSAYGA